VICLEQETLDLVKEIAPEVHSVIVPNPVFIDDHFSPADESDELVVFAGEIGLRKGADVLHRAWQLVAQRRPTAKCLMVGPLADFTPPSTERLDVRLPVGASEMKEILRAARVVALPSRAEAMPMILIEAMSSARPFVATPVGSIPELAAQGGLLVPVDDASSLADRLTELLAKPELARDIGQRGRRFCLETQSCSAIDERLRGLYSATAGQ
jgi:glycosyltransferase involved in cell wall biosynthesis